MNTARLFATLFSATLLLAGCGDFDSRTKNYEYVGELIDGVALCMEKVAPGTPDYRKEWFFVDEAGKTVSGRYARAYPFCNDYAVVMESPDRLHAVWKLLDRDFNERTLPGQVGTCQLNPSGCIWLYDQRAWRLYNAWEDRWMNVVPVAKMEPVVEDPATGIAILRNVVNGHATYAAYDAEGEELVPFGRYQTLYHYANGLCRFEVKSGTGLRYGYIDMAGNEVIPAIYARAGDFNEAGYAQVSIGDFFDVRYFYIDKQGRAQTYEDAARAEAASHSDPQLWVIGYTADGECFLLNCEGQRQSLGRGVRAARYEKIYAVRKADVYDVYVNLGGELSPLCTIKRSGAKEEYLHVATDDPYTPTLSLYHDGKVDRYRADGKYIDTQDASFGPRYLMGGAERDEDGEISDLVKGTLKF